MVAGEPSDHRLTSGFVQIDCTKSSMVEIGGQSAGWTQTEFHQRTRRRSPEDPEAGMLLSNIMEKGGAGQISAPRCQQTHLVSSAEAVPPIRPSLPEEEAAFGTVVEQGFDEGLFRFIEASGRCDLDEPSEEVPPRT
jgi:hypothetical protein